MSIKFEKDALEACHRLKDTAYFKTFIKEIQDILSKKREESDYPSDEKSMWINAGYRQCLRELIEACNSAGDVIKRIKENQVIGI